MNSSVKYYFSINDQISGPLTWDELLHHREQLDSESESTPSPLASQQDAFLLIKDLPVRVTLQTLDSRRLSLEFDRTSCPPRLGPWIKSGSIHAISLLSEDSQASTTPKIRVLGVNQFKTHTRVTFEWVTPAPTIGVKRI